MSVSRDVVWFEKSFPSTGIAASTFHIFSATANGTNALSGLDLSDNGAHKSLIGNIENVVVYNGAATVTGDMDVFVFSKATEGTNMATEAYLDHESFVTADWVTHNASPSMVAGAGLGIKYFDSDRVHQFHFGVKYNKAMTKECAKIRWAWRADRGE